MKSKGENEIIMKKSTKTIIVFVIILALVSAIEILNAIDMQNSKDIDYIPGNKANIHLYGETHGDPDYYSE